MVRGSITDSDTHYDKSCTIPYFVSVLQNSIEIILYIEVTKNISAFRIIFSTYHIQKTFVATLRL